MALVDAYGNGCFRTVNQKGEEANYPPGNSGWEGESALDVDMVSAVCPKCHILFVEATTATFKDLAESVNTAKNWAQPRSATAAGS